ncbi:hypothetical protein NBRC10513_007268 [Rhodotorula toruloides]
MASQALSSSPPLHQTTDTDDPPVVEDLTRPLTPTGRHSNIHDPHLSPASLARLQKLAKSSERSPSLADREFYEACWGKPNGFVVEGIGYIRSNLDLARKRPIMVREDYVTLYAHLESLPNQQNTDAILGYGSPGIGKSCFLRFAANQRAEECRPICWLRTPTSDLIIFTNEGLFAVAPKVITRLEFLVPPLVLLDAGAPSDVLPAEVYLGLTYPTIFTCSPNDTRYSRYLKDRLARVFAFDPIHRYELNQYITLLAELTSKKKEPLNVPLRSIRPIATLRRRTTPDSRVPDYIRDLVANTSSPSTTVDIDPPRTAADSRTADSRTADSSTNKAASSASSASSAFPHPTSTSTSATTSADSAQYMSTTATPSASLPRLASSLAPPASVAASVSPPPTADARIEAHDLSRTSASETDWEPANICSIRLELLPNQLPLLPHVQAHWIKQSQSSDVYTPMEVFASVGPTFRDIFEVSKTTGSLERDFFGSQVLAGPIHELARVLGAKTTSSSQTTPSAQQLTGYHQHLYEAPTTKKLTKMPMIELFVGSPLLLRRILDGIQQQTELDQRQLLIMLYERPSMFGVMFEGAVIRYFTLTDTLISSVTNPALNLVIPRALLTEHVDPSVHLPLDHDYIGLLPPNYPTFDCIIVLGTHKPPRLCLVQITVAPRHSMSPQGLNAVRDALARTKAPDALHLHFLWAHPTMEVAKKTALHFQEACEQARAAGHADEAVDDAVIGVEDEEADVAGVDAGHLSSREDDDMPPSKKAKKAKKRPPPELFRYDLGYVAVSSFDVFRKAKSAAANSSPSYSQYSYLPTPHSQFHPTPTIPSQVVQSAPSYPNTTVSPISPTFPIDASTPYMPASSDEVSQVVLAAAKCDKLGKIDLTGHSKQDDAPNRRATTCQSTLERSNGDDPSNYVGAFYWSVCVAVPPSSGGGIAGRRELAPPHPHNIYAGEATYYDTLTTAVDRYQGIDPKQQDIRPPPAPPGKTRSGFTAHVSMAGASKKRRQSVADDAEGVLACDVCRRDIGSGTLQLASTGEPVGATVEVICAHCEVRYTRCSDCGGGGGSKGVGRWRCKEMFPIGRRTCQLSHSRIGTVNEMDYDAWTVASIPAERITEVVDICRDLYFGQLLGTLAVPDMLESVAPIARSFHEVEKLAVDSWTHFERSKKKAAAAAAAADGEGTQSSPEDAKSAFLARSSEDHHDDEPQLIREGKVVTGFILAEQELESGILHVMLVARVHEDTHMLNQHRASMQLAPYPAVTVAWTMHMTKRDSRIMSRLETRRGFIPLEDFLVKYPDANKANFPPIRKTYLRPEFLHGWSVCTKRITSDDLPPDYQSPFASSASSTARSTAGSASSSHPNRILITTRR